MKNMGDIPFEKERVGFLDGIPLSLFSFNQ